MKFRLPMPGTIEELAALPYLDEDDLAIAEKDLKAIPLSDGWKLMIGANPEAAALWSMMESGAAKLLEPDFQGIPHGDMNLICFGVAQHTKCQWMTGIMSAATVAAAEQGGPDFNLAQLAHHAHPESSLWSEAQKLTLRFTEAFLSGTMTDDLFEQGRATWGEKKLMAHMLWIGFVTTWAMIENACNMTWEHGSVWAVPTPQGTALREKLSEENMRGMRATWMKYADLVAEERAAFLAGAGA